MIIGNKALQTAYAHALALDRTHAVLLALRLLRTYAAADRRQRGRLGNHLIRALIVLLGNARDKRRDVDADRAALAAGLVLAVQAAGRFVQRLLLGISEGNLIKIAVAHVCGLRRHFVFLQAHIRHSCYTPLNRLQCASRRSASCGLYIVSLSIASLKST